MENVFDQYGDSIQALLLNKLNTEDKERLLYEINSDESLKEFFEEEKLLFQKVNDSIDIEIFDKLKQNPFDESDTKPPNSSSIIIKSFILLVMLVTAVILYKLFFASLDTQELSKQYYVVNFSGTKSNEANDPYELAEDILENNKSNDFLKLREALTKVEPQSINYQKSKYLLAHLNYKEGKYLDAILLFEELTKMDRYPDESQWYLALSYLSNDEIEKSKKLLMGIIKSTSIFSKKAESLLSNLD